MWAQPLSINLSDWINRFRVQDVGPHLLYVRWPLASSLLRDKRYEMSKMVSLKGDWNINSFGSFWLEKNISGSLKRSRTQERTLTFVSLSCLVPSDLLSGRVSTPLPTIRPLGDRNSTIMYCFLLVNRNYYVSGETWPQKSLGPGIVFFCVLGWISDKIHLLVLFNWWISDKILG